MQLVVAPDAVLAVGGLTDDREVFGPAQHQVQR